LAGARVFKVGTTYRLYYAGYSTRRTDQRTYGLGLATSTDGVRWTKRTRQRALIAPGPSSFAILYDHGVWHMWSSRRFQADLSYRWSRDGLSWENPTSPVLTANRNPRAPDVELGDAVSVYRDGREYRVMYTGSNLHYANAQGRTEAICLATIADRYDPRPTVTITPAAPRVRAGGTATFVLRRDSVVGDLTVNFTIGGSAAAGQDYEPVAPTVTIPAGDTSASVRVQLHGGIRSNRALTLSPEASNITIAPGTPATAVIRTT
jgi:hypothetical protein